MSTREDCPKCGGVQTLNVMEGLLEWQRYCTACGLDETAPVTSSEPLPWARPGADPVAALFDAAATARATYYGTINPEALALFAPPPAAHPPRWELSGTHPLTAAAEVGTVIDIQTGGTDLAVRVLEARDTDAGRVLLVEQVV